MSVILKVGSIFTDIEGLSSDLFIQIQQLMSYRPEGYEFSPMFNKWITREGKKVRMWDGWRRQIWKNQKRTYFPTGLFSIAKDFLSKNNVQYQILDRRKKPAKELILSLSSAFENKDFQQNTISQSCLVQRGIIMIATGGGKTAISAGLIKELGVKPFIFFVTSIDLLIQAKESFQSFLLENGQPLNVGQIGGGVIDIKDVNVMTVQTAVRALGKKWDNKLKFDSEDDDDKTPIEQRKDDILRLLNTAKGCICDEVQHWRAETCQLVNRALHDVYYVYGASATPFRDDGDDLLVHACFGKKITEINASYLIKQNYLVKPSIKIVHIRNKPSPYRQWQQLYKDQVSENKEYNEIVSSVANAFIAKGRTVLVLVQQIAHGKALAELIPGSIFLSGKSTKTKRQEGIEKLRRKEISCIVGSSIWDEGVDVRCLDTLLLAGQGKSKVRAMQRIGRILRPFPGKNGATAIDFRIHQKYLLEHSIAREKMYRSEPEFSIEEIEP